MRSWWSTLTWAKQRAGWGWLRSFWTRLCLIQMESRLAGLFANGLQTRNCWWQEWWASFDDHIRPSSIPSSSLRSIVFCPAMWQKLHSSQHASLSVHSRTRTTASCRCCSYYRGLLPTQTSRRDPGWRRRVSWWGWYRQLYIHTHSTLMLKIYFPFSEKEDNFDWAKYLMEGEDFDTGPYPDTPVSQSEPTLHLPKQRS